MEMSRKYRQQENHYQVVLQVIKVFLCSFFQIECAVFDCLICCKGIREGSFYTVFVLAGSSQDDHRSRRKPGRLLATFFSRCLQLVPKHGLLVQSQNDGLRII